MTFQNLMFVLQKTDLNSVRILSWSRVLGQGPPEVSFHQKDSATLLPATTIPLCVNCCLLCLFASLSSANLSILAAVHTQGPHCNTL